MNHVEFDHEMQIMVTEFKSVFTAGRMKLIWDFVEDLDTKDLRKINAHFLASSRTAPLPIDYRDAARKEKQAKPQHFHKNDSPHVMLCVACNDVGVVRLDHNGYWTLALCDAKDRLGRKCTQGDWQIWKLPFASEVAGAKTEVLPWQEFKPDIKTKNFSSKSFFSEKKDDDLKQIKFGGAIKEKVVWWRERVRIAEAYWNKINKPN